MVIDSRVEDRRRNDRRNDRKKDRKKRARKKQRNGCLSCLLTLVIVLVVFVGALYGGGMFAWNTYAQPKFGISFNDALGLVGGVYSVKEKDVITNAYGEEDVDGFYSELSDALFLDSSIDLRTSLSDVLDEFIAGMVAKDESSTTDGTTDGTDSSVSTAEEESSSSGSTGNEALDNFLKELKFDFSRLKDYEDEYVTPEILEITDKQTAAFLDDAIKSALNKEAIKSQLPEMVQSVNLGNIVDIPQIIVTKVEEDGIEKTALTLTIRLNLRSTIKEVASSYNKALGAVAYLLPKTFLATATIYPDDYLHAAEIRVNSFSKEKMNNAYSIANYFLKDTDYGSIDGILKMVNQKAIEMVEKVQQVVPVNFVATGSMEMHPIKALMNVLGATEVTETQFYCMIRDLFLPTFDDVKTTLGFSETTTYDDVLAMIETGKQAVVDEISSKLGVEAGYLTADNMLTKLQGIGGEDSELIEKISLSNIAYGDSYVEEDAKMRIPYNGLVGLLSGYLNDATSTDDSTSEIPLEMINATYDESSETLTLVLKIGVQELIISKIDSSSSFSGIVNQIIPEAIYIRAAVSLADEDTSAAGIMINNRDLEGTQDLLNTINGLMGSLGGGTGLDYESLSSTIATKARDGIKDLNAQLGNAFLFKNEAAYLPSLYEIMANKSLIPSLAFVAIVEDNDS